MSKPQRIQRKRTKGWRMPENTVYVGRPGKWGNPFQSTSLPMNPERRDHYASMYRHAITEDCFCCWPWETGIVPHTPEEIRKELAGKNLACWCPLDQPCHADVLLEIANKEHE